MVVKKLKYSCRFSRITDWDISNTKARSSPPVANASERLGAVVVLYEAVGKLSKLEVEENQKNLKVRDAEVSDPCPITLLKFYRSDGLSKEHLAG